MNEEAGDAAGARVDILVGTKYSEINTPVVQREGHVSHGMRKIPSTDTTLKSKTISTRSTNKEVEEEQIRETRGSRIVFCVCGET